MAGPTGAWSLAQKFGAIFCRRAVTDRHMRPDVVVLVAVDAGDALGLEDIDEQFPVEAFVPKLAVEAFVDAVLPGAARLDESGLDARTGQPFFEIAGDELTAVITAQVQRCAVDLDQRHQRRDYVNRPEPTAGDDVQAEVAELVHDGEELHGHAAGRDVE